MLNAREGRLVEAVLRGFLGCREDDPAAYAQDGPFQVFLRSIPDANSKILLQYIGNLCDNRVEIKGDMMDYEFCSQGLSLHISAMLTRGIATQWYVDFEQASRPTLTVIATNVAALKERNLIGQQQVPLKLLEIAESVAA